MVNRKGQRHQSVHVHMLVKPFREGLETEAHSKTIRVSHTPTFITAHTVFSLFFPPPTHVAEARISI